MRAIPLAALVLTACSGSDSVYAPTGANTWNDGYPSAVMPAPPGAPAGTVEVASFGLIELTPADMPPMMTLHVRVVAANSSDRPWRVDLPAATVRAGTSESRTLLANSDLATLPVALVERGQPRTFDLYFAAPGGIRDEDELAELDFRIPVVTAERTFQTQVHFARREQLDLPALRGDPVRAAGWGSHWWADPQYAWPAFYQRPGIATPRPPARAAVNRLPRWQRPRSTP
jgi:hypothetical protein